MDVMTVRDEHHQSGREVVWSRPPDAEAKLAAHDKRSQATEAREPGPRGEHDISVKTVAQGRPG
jgi:hypothetical protein